MESLKIKICNYRSIPQESPIEFEIKEGINFILGVNNVGKSNLLKLFYDFRQIVNYIVSSIPHGNIGQEGSNSISLNETFDHLVNQNSTTNEIHFEVTYDNLTIVFTIQPKTEERHTSTYFFHYRTVWHDGVVKNENCVKAMSLFRNTFYIGPFRSGLSNSSGQHFDISVGIDFISLWDSWSTGVNIQKIKVIRELIVELKELFSYNNFDIKVNQQNNNLIIDCDDGTFLLNELGDGIGHFIIVLANVLIRQPSIVLIDEPEIGLHPRMQEVFIRALSSKTKFGLLATSHSIGLARSVGDYIYSLTKSKGGKVNLSPFGQHHSTSISQSVSEMGYSQYAELGGNNILLVEGRTDIKSFREILRKFELDKYFIIISFGGRQFITTDKTNIIEELSELKRFNTNVFVIFDSERTKPNEELKPEFKVFAEVCKELNFIVFPTDYHSTDNYISQNAVDKIIGGGLKALSPYEKSDIWTNSVKKKNWLMFREMSREDFNTTELKKFIEKGIIPVLEK